MEAKLEQLFRRRAVGIRLDLESLRAVFNAMGSPAGDVPAIHIVGTNGKGSIAAMCESVLRRRGLRVGLYTSPHLQRVTERVRIDGVEVDVAQLGAAVRRVLVHETPKLPRPLSFFEVLTLAAMDCFARAGLDALVIEAGLGGRYDATRIVNARAIGVATIAHDHEVWLGNTLDAIAAEKAAVFRHGVPVITGPQDPEVTEVLERQANTVGASLQRVLPLAHAPLSGAHQRTNAAVALEICRLWFSNASEVDLDDTQWPARLERVHRGSGAVIFDAGHNLDAIQAVVASLAVSKRPMRVLFGCQPDKPRQAMIERLSQLGLVEEVELDASPDRVKTWVRWCDAWLASGHDVLVIGSHQLVGPIRGMMIEQEARSDPSDPR